MYLGVAEGKVVGFVGEHIEGSLGMLQVLDEYRKKGYGGELEKAMIAKHLEKGYTPFAHVEVHNTASINLQKRIGMEFLEKKIVWLY